VWVKVALENKNISHSAVLIKDNLGIALYLKVLLQFLIKENTCTFSVHSFQLIVEVLLPIFDKYPCTLY